METWQAGVMPTAGWVGGLRRDAIMVILMVGAAVKEISRNRRTKPIGLGLAPQGADDHNNPSQSLSKEAESGQGSRFRGRLLSAPMEALESG